MKQYMVRMVEDGKRKYYYILDNDVFQLVPLPTKYLKHKIEANRSPNTVRRVALSLCYYLQYLSEIGIELTEVSDLGFEDQSKHFVQFLYWLKEGRHIADNRIGKTGNGTCNAYLRDVFGFFLYLADGVLLEQIRTLDRRRLLCYVNHLDQEAMRLVDRAISISLGL